MRSVPSICILAFLAMLFVAGTVLAQDASSDLDDYRSRLQGMSAAELQSEASRLESGVAEAEKEIDALETKLASAPDEEKDEIQSQIDEKKQAVDGELARLGAAVKAMKGKELDVTDFEQFLMQRGKLDSVSVTAAVGLASYYIEKGKDWAIENGPALLLKLVGFLLVLVIFKILAGVLSRATEKALSMARVKAPELLKNFFINVVAKTTFLVGLLIALSVLGVPLGPILAGVGVLGFVVGFALQDTLANFAAGIMVLLYRPYDVGDFVVAGGVTGKVSAMSLVSTTFLTPDNKVEIVPNGKIWGDRITNITTNPKRRVDLTFGIGYGDDFEKAEKLLVDLVSNHPLVLKDPEPVVKLHELGESSVNFVVRPWTNSADYWTVYWDITKSVKKTFDKEGISIPFPQRDIHIVTGGEAIAGSKA